MSFKLSHLQIVSPSKSPAGGTTDSAVRCQSFFFFFFFGSPETPGGLKGLTEGNCKLGVGVEVFYSSSDLFGMENSCFVHDLVSLKSGYLFKIEFCTRKNI